MPRAHPGVIHPASHRPGHYAVSPPSTSMTVPVTYNTNSDIKNPRHRPAAAATTIDPRFASRSAGSAARVNNPAATIFNAIVCSHTAAVVSSIEAQEAPPAAMNNASNPPKLSSVAASAASQSSAAVISATTSAELAISIDIVDAPLLVSSSMLAKPMPEAPPTTATFNPDTPGKLV